MVEAEALYHESTFAKSIYAKKGQQRLTYSGVLRPGYIRFQDEFQLSYSQILADSFVDNKNKNKQ